MLLKEKQEPRIFPFTQHLAIPHFLDVFISTRVHFPNFHGIINLVLDLGRICNAKADQRDIDPLYWLNAEFVID